ncbi:hypothetical protein BH11BAC7_BH11BAC7_06030 [soil metagenome]
MVLDIIGQFLLYLMCITPVFTIPFAWKIVEKKFYSVLLGLGMACLLSIFLLFISLAICFRNGMGPL